jgi:putative spermidine/putrescine transport system ATP-binding protein
VFKPKALLMDEPLGSLDKKLRDEMELEIRRLHKQLGVTVIYVTHDQEEALTMSERIAIMNHGRIDQLGSPSDVYEFPKTVFVASFIGESNFFDGEVVDVVAEQVVVRTESGSVLRAKSHEHLDPGQHASIAVRPERAFFCDEDADPANSVSGVLEEAIYVGTNIRFGVRLSTGQVVVVRKPGPFGDRYPRPGDQTRVGWSAEESIALAPGPEAVSTTEGVSQGGEG